MSERFIIESLRGSHNYRTLLEDKELVREYFKGNDGRTYSVRSIIDGGEDEIQISVLSPYDLTDYCYAHQAKLDPDKEYDPDESDDDQLIWHVYSPKGTLISTLPGSSSWVAVADEISRQDDNENLVPQIDRT